ncbi:MAG TPA: arsenate reductase ArsC [Thermoanaerobaculaceae bacterium]|nr:arsenate reductase ArsC [Thermoanaerobaculaceae bacterium]
MTDHSDRDDKKTVLFLCTGNSCRSQMAEAFLRHMAGDRFNVVSAGLDPAADVHPLAVRVMAEKGLDISSQRPKSVKEYLGYKTAHVVITVCDRAAQRCPTTWPGALERHHWPFDDPAAFEGTEPARLAKFREVRDEIERKIRSWSDDGLPWHGRTTKGVRTWPAKT